MSQRMVGQVIFGVLMAALLSSVLVLAQDSTCYCVSTPESVAVCLGTSAEFSVSASGEGVLSYQWYHGASALRDGGRISGATTALLRVAGVEASDAGEYSVTVTGARGQVTSLPAELAVKAPTVITKDPEDVSVCPGEAVDFAVSATGEGVLTYQWSHDGAPLADNAWVSGAATAHLAILHAEAADAGEYAVTVTGECGAVDSAAAILVVKAPTVIADDPNDASVCPGTTVDFAVSATGEGTLAYQWSHDGAPLTDDGRISGTSTAQLLIVSVEDADAGAYSVTITGECGQATSAAATLMVKAPTVIAAQPEDASVCPGTTVDFVVSATGEGTLAYQWYHNDVMISDATSPQLQIVDVDAADAGEYTVTVTGECGLVTSKAAALIVKAPTVIAIQPQDVSVYFGDSTAFSITATGEEPLAYQWYHGSTPLADDERISGATTSELQITDVQSTDAGRYSVTVTGACGEVSSDVARLRATQPMGQLGLALTNQPQDVLLVLDLSSSMDEKLGGVTKLALAQEAIEALVGALPGETRVGLRTFLTCGRSNLDVPIQPVSSGRLLSAVRGLETAGKTPIAYTLRQIPGDLAGLEGPHVVVFLTDGTETCNEDPVAAARELAAAKLDLIFHLIGFDIARVGGQAAHESLLAIAEAAKGVYLPLEAGDQLASTILDLILPPSFRVYDSAGALVQEGFVGGAAFELPTGTYRIVVDTNPESVFENVQVKLDQTTSVTVRAL